MTFQHLAFGARRLAFGVWRLAFGVWRLAFGVRRSAFGVRRSRFGNRFRPRIGTPLFIGALDSDKTFSAARRMGSAFSRGRGLRRDSTLRDQCVWSGRRRTPNAKRGTVPTCTDAVFIAKIQKCRIRPHRLSKWSPPIQEH
jgi:hypothetical protein